MGFIQITVGAAWDSLKSSFGDQFLDFLVPPQGLTLSLIHISEPTRPY